MPEYPLGVVHQGRLLVENFKIFEKISILGFFTFLGDYSLENPYVNSVFRKSA